MVPVPPISLKGWPPVIIFLYLQALACQDGGVSLLADPSLFLVVGMVAEALVEAYLCLEGWRTWTWK